MRRPGHLLLVGACFLAGCRRSSAAPAARAAPARCAILADSVAAIPLADRTVAVPVGRLDIDPRALAAVFATAAGEVRATFAVDAAGRADTATVSVEGLPEPAAAEFRTGVARAVAEAHFRPPAVGGCPVAGRGDVRLRPRGGAEVRRTP